MKRIDTAKYTTFLLATGRGVQVREGQSGYWYVFDCRTAPRVVQAVKIFGAGKRDKANEYGRNYAAAIETA